MVIEEERMSCHVLGRLSRCTPISISCSLFVIARVGGTTRTLPWNAFHIAFARSVTAVIHDTGADRGLPCTILREAMFFGIITHAVAGRTSTSTNAGCKRTVSGLYARAKVPNG